MSATEGESTDMQKFGRFQIVQMLLTCLPVATVSMMNVNFIFLAEDVDHRCRVPECDNATATADIPDYWPIGIDARCYRPVLDQEYRANETCSNRTFSGDIQVCSDWIYEHNNSIMSELNLGCQSWKSTIVGTVHNAGMMFSMSIGGWIADNFGRKPAVIICSISGTVGVIKIFLTNYYGYLIIEFLESLLAPGIYTVAIVLMIEVGGDSKRVVTGVLFSYAVYFGEICFAFISIGLQYWKHIAAIVYTPLMLFGIYVFILKESMRWQFINEKIAEVKETLKIVTRVNKIDVTEKEINEISSEELIQRFNAVSQKKTENMKDIISSKEIIIRLGVVCLCFFTSSFVYYGLAVQSVHLPGNKYTNFVLSSTTSFPSDLLALYVLEKYGRRITLQCSYLFLGVFLTASSFSPEHLSWLVVLLFLLSKAGTVICFTAVYTYGLELFPTSVRGTLFGICNTIARIGSMLAPLTILLRNQYKALPSILFSSAALISAFLLIYTPETKTLPMFDTIGQVECSKGTLNDDSHRSGNDVKNSEISRSNKV